MTEGIIQKVFNDLITDIENRLEEKTKWIIIRDCYKREKELIEEIILLNVFQNNPMLMKLLIGESK